MHAFSNGMEFEKTLRTYFTQKRSHENLTTPKILLNFLTQLTLLILTPLPDTTNNIAS